MSAGRARLRRLAAAAWLLAFQPPERLTVSEWADKYRMLSQERAAVAVDAGQAVPWSTATVPYLREIMDALGEGRYRECVFAKSAQVGGTSVDENWIGQLIHQRPQPVLMIWPTDKKLRHFTTKALDPMIRDTPVLAAKLPKSNRRDSSNTQEAKQFPGGYLQMLTAKSTADLRSFSAGIVICEEVDEWEGDVNQQGDPLRMARARAITFPRYVLYLLSTPGLEETSRIWPLYEDSSRGTYLVPCPHCGAEQALVWRDAEGRYRLVYDTEEGEPVYDSVAYLCAACDRRIEETAKPAMLAAGRWEHAAPAHFRGGWHIWSAYSPFVTWASILQEFRASKANPAMLKTFDTLWLGLPHKSAVRDVAPHVLKHRAEPYEADIPAGVRFVTGAVDVQLDRLELLRVGWGLLEESWVLALARDAAALPYIEGNPTEDETWQRLWAELFRPLAHASGALLIPISIGVDTGYLSETAWRWANAYRARGAFPLRGGGGLHDPWVKAPGLQKAKRTQARLAAETRPVFMVGDQQIKTTLHQRWQIREPGPGYIHLPEGLDDAWFDQVTAETLKTVVWHGQLARRWVLPPHRRNEALDLMVYNIAAWAKLPLAYRRAAEQGLLGVVPGHAAPVPGVSAVPAVQPVTRPAVGRRIISRGFE